MQLLTAVPPATGRAPRVLLLGAHSDDIEIGCGGTILEFLERHPGTEVIWGVLSADGDRREEAEAAAAAFLKRAGKVELRIGDFRDGHFPWQGSELKDWFEALKSVPSPDIIFTHHRDDRHQDHRTVSELTWNTFRNHLILEYEVPKFDGELGNPNTFVPLTEARVEQKIELLMHYFGSQAARAWFTPATFRSVLRLRGLEAGLAPAAAEAFHGRKLVLDW